VSGRDAGAVRGFGLRNARGAPIGDDDSRAGRCRNARHGPPKAMPRRTLGNVRSFASIDCHVARPAANHSSSVALASQLAVGRARVGESRGSACSASSMYACDDDGDALWGADERMDVVHRTRGCADGSWASSTARLVGSSDVARNSKLNASVGLVDNG